MPPSTSLMDGRKTKPSTIEDFIPKRPHKKSRSGCHGCKQRKIKCDESQPRCTYCKTRDLKCVYPGKSDSPASTNDLSRPLSISGQNIASSPSHKSHEFAKTLMLSHKPNPTFFINGMTLDDSRLLHHFKTVTSQTLFPRHSTASRAAADQIPLLSLEHDFMMHCILGIASLHLNRLQPEKPELQALVVAHRANTFGGLRKAISRPSTNNSKAILAASLSILILACDRSIANPGQLWITSWFALWAGMREMIRLISWEFLVQSGLSPMFAKDDRPLAALGKFPTSLMDLIATMDPGDDNTRTIVNGVLCLGKLYEYLLFPNPGVNFDTLVVGWPANIEIASFTSLLKQSHPQALVIVSYYLVFTKLMKMAWWMDGVADPEIEAIASIIPLKYQYFLLMPMQAVHLAEKRDIANLLISQLPANSVLDANAASIETMESGFTCSNKG